MIFIFILYREVATKCTDGSPGCVGGKCAAGYELDILYERNCQNIDECARDNHGCDQKCIDTDGSYYCRCDDGFVKIGVGSCEDIDECSGGGHGCDHCVNHQGSYECTCPAGYELNRDRKTCRDIHECLKDQDTGKTLHNCPTNSICVNTDGSYECNCDRGYQWPSDSRRFECEDIDECAAMENVCRINAKSEDDKVVCENTIGSFKCICPANYVLSSNKCYYNPTIENKPVTNAPSTMLSPTRIFQPTETRTTGASTETTGYTDTPSSFSGYIQIGLIAGAALVLIVLVAAAIIFCKRRQKSGKKDSRGHYSRPLQASDLDSPDDETHQSLPAYAEEHYGVKRRAFRSQDSADSFETLSNVSSEGSIDRPQLSKFGVGQTGAITDYSTLPPPPSSMTSPTFEVHDDDQIVRGASQGSILANPNYPKVVPLLPPK